MFINAVRSGWCVRTAFCLLALISMLGPAAAHACKDRFYPKAFPLEELDHYEHVYIVRVDDVTVDRSHAEGWYARPFSFKGTITQTFKGSSKPGDTIQAVTSSNDEAHARCPISLEAGKVYLLMLNGTQLPYILPRYGSLYVSSDQPEFRRYVAQLAADMR